MLPDEAVCEDICAGQIEPRNWSRADIRQANTFSFEYALKRAISAKAFA
jgi:hypothetical protein